jgi:7-cyano-7-deazaguanine synthase
MTINNLLLASGGLDSTTLAYWLTEKSIEFTPVFINYGQHCASTELETLKLVLEPKTAALIEEIDISSIYRHSKSRLISEADLWNEPIHYEELYLPYRNLLLLSVAAAYAQSRGSERIYAAFINSNHAKELDCSTDFFKTLSAVLRDYGSVHIEMPFRTMSKYQVALEGIRLRAPIAKTFSCQISSSIPCGACPNCVDRLDALKLISNLDTLR